jgi:hypothetical protein
MTFCPLCGRKYVREALVVRPPTKEEVLAAWRAKKRAAKATGDEPVAEPTATVIPAARLSDEGSLAVAPKLLTAGAAAMFVSAFALGESVMALNLFR